MMHATCTCTSVYPLPGDKQDLLNAYMETLSTLFVAYAHLTQVSKSQLPHLIKEPHRDGDFP